MDHNLLIKALNASKKGEKYVLATVIEATLKGTPQKSGAKMIVYEDGTIFGTIGGGRYEKQAQKEGLKALKTNLSKLVTYQYFGKKGQSICGGEIKVFIEPVAAVESLIICGAGHIALPLSVLGKMLKFRVTVIDNRKGFANRTRFPHVDEILLGNHAKRLSKINLGRNSYVMIVTQGNEFDFECLKSVVRSDAKYIGVISSKLKRIKFFKRLKEMGIEPKYLRRISIPAGIDLGAQSPEEIATSIASEIVKMRNKHFVGTAKFK